MIYARRQTGQGGRGDSPQRPSNKPAGRHREVLKEAFLFAASSGFLIQALLWRGLAAYEEKGKVTSYISKLPPSAQNAENRRSWGDLPFWGMALPDHSRESRFRGVRSS